MGISSGHIGFSPDGRFLAIGYREQDTAKVALFALPDGRKVRTITIGKKEASYFTFTADGRLIVDDNGQLWFVRVTDGKKEKIDGMIG